MKFQIKINEATTVDEILNYWSAEDYVRLLERFEYPDAEKGNKDNLRELLLMAITDFEPNEAAAIILDYKLSDHLKDGQIQQISNDMLLDKIAEEYPEIGLQSTLFHINQLLFKAFNGKFPNTKATIIDCSISPSEENEEVDFSKEMVLKLLSPGLADSNLIKRLFGEKMIENKPFPEAENILWSLDETANGNIKMLTSAYWLSKDDLLAREFEAVFEKAEVREEE